jgi:hypothetical protein
MNTALRDDGTQALNAEARRKSETTWKVLRKIWLGGLDSNQDNQIQNLMYCRLYDLPAEGDKKSAEIAGTGRRLTSGYLYFIHELKLSQPRAGRGTTGTKIPLRMVNCAPRH